MAVYKSIQIKKNLYDNEGHIIFLDYSVNAKSGIVQALDIETIHYSHYKEENWINRTLAVANYSQRITSRIKELLRHSDKPRLFLYLDNVLLFSSIIEYAATHIKNLEIVLIEEGAGLYTKPSASKPYVDRGVYVKKIVYKILGLSTFSAERKKQAENPYIHTIICSDIDKFKESGKYRGQELIRYKEKYCELECNSFLSKLPCEYINIIKKFRNFRYVFVSEPIFDVIGVEKGIKLIQEVINKLSANGSILFKQHPRDLFDYSFLASEKVMLFPDILKEIPMECMHNYLVDSQMVTFHSSVVINVETKYKPILLYPLLNSDFINSVVTNSGFDLNRMIIIKDIEDLK